MGRYHNIEEGDKEFLEECPLCDGYMVPTWGNWYQCSECGVEAEENEYGLLGFDESVFVNK